MTGSSPQRAGRDFARLVRAVAHASEQTDRCGMDVAWPRPRPGFPATSVEITTVAATLGVRFSPEYAALLAVVGGWERMCEDLHLLSPADLLTGDLHDRADVVTEALPSASLSHWGCDRWQVTPIAVSTTASEVALLVVDGALTGDVLWATEAGVAHHPGVYAWLEGMLAETERMLAVLSAPPRPHIPPLLGARRIAAAPRAPGC